MADQPRNAFVRLFYNDVEISTDIAPFLTKFEFSDSIEKAADLQVTLYDDGRWRNSWFPEQGALLKAYIGLREPGKRPVSLYCGLFAIDEPEFEGGGNSPSTCVIKGTSAYVTTALRAEVKTRGWESVSLKSVGASIAAKAGLKYSYLSDVNPQFTRVDQRFSSDLPWLMSKAQAAGIRVKISNGQLTLYSGDQFDQQPSIATITPETAIQHNFKFGRNDAYKACEVKWRDVSSKKTHFATYAPPGAPVSGQTLRINERCQSQADAIRIAQFRLEAANRKLNTCELTVPGNVVLLPGSNIDTWGWGGKLDGKWGVEDAKHSLWPYTTTVTGRLISNLSSSS